MIYWLAKCAFLIWFLTSGPYVIKKATDDQLLSGKKKVFFSRELLIEIFDIFPRRQEIIYLELPDDENKSSIAGESGNNEKRDEHTVAGGYGFGIKLKDFISVNAIEVDDDGTVFVADWMNARIVQWKCGATTGEIVAGGNGRGEENNQLKQATNFVYDKKSDSFIICDTGNSRVIRWPRGSKTYSETIAKGFGCVGIAIDDEGFIYISDETNSEVRRWRIGDAEGTLVAGGNGEGDRLDQLYCPSYLFVDKDHSVYITDRGNNRVVKWTNGAKEGIVVAGVDGAGSSLSNLTLPAGVIVDEHETVYVADSCNNRVVKWPKDAKQGIIFVGGSELNNEIDSPQGLAFDGHGNIYIADSGNYRVQKYPIDSN